MAETPLKKLKNGVLTYTSALLVRIDLVAEESRLNDKFKKLGEKVMSYIEKNNLESLKDDASIVELLGAIHENKTRIQELKTRNTKTPNRTSEEG
ncbi:MAG: hypothetical protein GX116_09190 [Fibrobacter sp.]|jgi:predicted house-cleaning noncanonical NTP pyrophosphatase (MazG superfamily)|nr:hypothetical protein [Fibrobacter sp.]